jgi:hypothetical protein
MAALICTQAGQPYTGEGFKSMWQRTLERAVHGVKDAKTGRQCRPGAQLPRVAAMISQIRLQAQRLGGSPQSLLVPPPDAAPPVGRGT